MAFLGRAGSSPAPSTSHFFLKWLFLSPIHRISSIKYLNFGHTKPHISLDLLYPPLLNEDLFCDSLSLLWRAASGKFPPPWRFLNGLLDVSRDLSFTHSIRTDYLQFFFPF